MRRAALLLILPLAACHGLGRRAPGASPAGPAPFDPPPAEVVPADAAGRQALWSQVFSGDGAMPPGGADALIWIFGKPVGGGAPSNPAKPVEQWEFNVPPWKRTGILVLEEDPASGALAGAFIVEGCPEKAAGKEVWHQVASGTGVGPRKIVRFGQPEHLAKLRVRFTGEAPVLARCTAHAVPARVAVRADALDFLDSTTVRLATDQPGAVIRYTLDGSVPTPASPAYDPAKPLVLDKTTQVRAAAEDDGQMSPLSALAKVVAWDRSRLRPAAVFALAPERGLAYACYEGVQSFDALRGAEPVSAGACEGPVPQAPKAGGAQVCEGYLQVEGDGLYALEAAGKVRVWLDGEQAVEGGATPVRATVALRAGWHPVRVEWLGDQAPQVKCFGPGCPEDGKIAPGRWGR